MESGDAREVHHFALLVGYGAGAINPYLALDTVKDLAETGQINGTDSEYAQTNFIKANEKGVLKVMSKMGISTVQSYRGAQIFEAIGLNQELIDEYFTWTPSRVGGIGLDGLERETSDRHYKAFVSPDIAANTDLDMGGAISGDVVENTISGTLKSSRSYSMPPGPTTGSHISNSAEGQTTRHDDWPTCVGC